MSSLEVAPSRMTPELRATGFYLTIFMTAGATAVYGGIWLSGMGMSAEQIGIINAVPVLLMLVFNLVVGRIADRARDWRQVIVAGALLAAVMPVGLFFVGDFWGILLFWTLAAMPVMAIGPVADAAAMRMTRRHGTDFGAIRAWGTIGYMAAIFATGYVVAWLGPASFLPLFLALSLLRGGMSLVLPNFRAPADQQQAVPAAAGAKRLLEVMQPWFLLPLVGWAMVFGTHLVLNAFQGLLWKGQGIPADIIGPLMALAAFSEAAMMFAFRRFALRVPARYLILVSALVAVLRWIAMGFSPGVELLVPLQMLHSITFALGLLGCMNFIANWTSEDIAAEAQSFFVVLQQGMSVVALVGFGWLVGLVGAQAYFVAAAFALLGGLLVLASVRMQQPKPT